jgi:2'-5' RNA ligase
MRLYAALVPPRDLREELVRLVRSADPPVGERAGRRRWGRWSGGGGSGVQESPPPSVRELALRDVDTMHLRLAGFGNVSQADSRRLLAALRAEAATWAPATVQVAGGAALEFPGDESVWATLEGDVDALLSIGRAVPQVVQRLGHFVDRRQFRPWLSVATITPETTAPYLEQVVALLQAHRSAPWTVDALSVLRRPMAGEDQDRFEEVERLPLAGS